MVEVVGIREGLDKLETKRSASPQGREKVKGIVLAGTSQILPYL